MKKWRVILGTGQEPIWPFCIASLSMSPLPIPLRAPHDAVSTDATSVRSALHFLKSWWIERILMQPQARGASASRQ